MLRVRRAKERLHQRHGTHESWSTFHADELASNLAAQLAPLETLREVRLPAQAVLSECRGPSEVITYVREGTVAFEDSTGRAGLIHAGQFQRMTAGPGVHFQETNPSPTRRAHVYQLWLALPRAGREQGHEVRLFSVAQRRGLWCVVASPDGRRGSLRLGQDTLLYSVILRAGQHLIQALPSGRSAWLHVVTGSLDVAGLEMETGDGVGFVAEPAVSVTCRAAAELLLLELGAPAEATQ